eukprot:CAMPEP_0178992712 /NCGR_PEP_ID=MMETSP0795-20121207/6272_1 /TAXON_ID=88552 /ORGANISM="Amoebophrya sp., Strain Ameob2" /LENGTH=453 /DNA_ID=CAMNT_0020684635 /DNA_START=62 /DNA_END=1423 /DNA_ORIENTATION=-
MPDDGGDGMPMPTGLGNFKGVMLCNRPDIVAPKTKDPTELPPFYSAVAPGALEPPGMLHPTTLNPLAQKKDVPEAFKRHRKMLVEMQDNLNASKSEDFLKSKAKEEQVVGHREKCADQRQAVRDALRDAEEGAQTKNNPKFLNKLRDAVAVSEDRLAMDVGEMNKTNMAGSANSSSSSKVVANKTSSSKPAWALTKKQKEEMEEQEVADLLSFANNLNFEEYVEDLEFRQALSALKGRATDLLSRTEKKFQQDLQLKKQELIAEVTAENLSELEDLSAQKGPQAVAVMSGVSQSVSQRGVNVKNTQEEASEYYSTEPESEQTVSSVSSFSSYGYATLRRKKEEAEKLQKKASVEGGKADGDEEEDEAASSVASTSSKREQAAEILREKPEMKAIHSKESIVKMVEKLAAGIEEMSKKPANRMPLIVLSDDHHPVQREQLDPKKVAYLYRSPAI